MSIENAQPINGGNNGVKEDDTPDITQQAPGQTPKTTGTPPPTTAERQEAKAAKEAADAAAQAEIEGKKPEEPGAEIPGDEPKDKPADDDAELDTTQWGDIDKSDEVTYSTLQLLQNSGVTPADAKAMLWDAVEAGDPTKIDRDALVEKVGKAKATLILAGVNAHIEDTSKRIRDVKAVVVEVAGSSENWDKVRQWAQKGIPAADLDEYRAMIDKGGKSAKFAAAEIVEKYNADAKNSSIGTKKAITPGTKPTGTKLEPLSRREYGLALDKAHNRRAKPAEIAQLRARRNLGIQQGI